MDYELVKRLKEDGLQWSTVNLFEAKGNEVQTENYPTLEELISAVPKSIGKATFVLGSANQGKEWIACYFDFVTHTHRSRRSSLARATCTPGGWTRSKAIALRSRGISLVGKAYRACIVRKLT
jgi:hypothetical protein